MVKSIVGAIASFLLPKYDKDCESCNEGCDVTPISHLTSIKPEISLINNKITSVYVDIGTIYYELEIKSGSFRTIKIKDRKCLEQSEMTREEFLNFKNIIIDKFNGEKKEEVLQIIELAKNRLYRVDPRSPRPSNPLSTDRYPY